MNDNFIKLYGSILASTIWSEDPSTRLVWITLLVMTGEDGIARVTVPGLARLANVPLEDCERALEILRSPDKYSRTSDYEGRRIEDVEGGFFVLNRKKYADKRTKKQVKDAQRKREARMSTDVHGCPSVSHRVAPETERERETEEEREKDKHTLGRSAERVMVLWNEMTKDTPIPSLQSIAGSRRKKLSARLKEHKNFDEMLVESLKFMLSEPFYRGDNDRGWTGNFDYVLQPGKLVSLYERAMAAKKSGPKSEPSRKDSEPSPEYKNAMAKLMAEREQMRRS